VTFSLNYRGGTEQLNALPMVEFLRSYDLLKKGGAPAVDVASVKNKIVLIAATGEGRAFFVSNPFSERYPSVGLHATVIEDNAAIGENTVHVEKQQHDMLRLLASASGNTLHGTVKFLS